MEYYLSPQICWFRRRFSEGLALHTPLAKPLFSERHGLSKPVFSFCGFRLFRLDPVQPRLFVVPQRSHVDKGETEMSLQSWKKEFYPISAQRAAKGSAVETIEHSLKKWTGLRKKHLDRHDLSTDYGGIRGTGQSFYIDAVSCSLCAKFYDDASADGNSACRNCPLAKARGSVSCAFRLAPTEPHSPYWAWITRHDPEPMIFWLKKTLEDAKEVSRGKGNASGK